MNAFQYIQVPRGYACAKCSANAVRLWRQSNTFANHIELMCCACGEIDQEAKLEDGSDHLGNLVPAIPTEDGDTFW